MKSNLVESALTVQTPGLPQPQKTEDPDMNGHQKYTFAVGEKNTLCDTEVWLKIISGKFNIFVGVSWQTIQVLTTTKLDFQSFQDLPKSLQLAYLWNTVSPVIKSMNQAQAINPRLECWLTNDAVSTAAAEADLLKKIINFHDQLHPSQNHSMVLCTCPEAHHIIKQSFQENLASSADNTEIDMCELRIELGVAKLAENELINLQMNDIIFFQAPDASLADKLWVDRTCFEIHRSEDGQGVILGPWPDEENEFSPEEIKELQILSPLKPLPADVFNRWTDGEMVNLESASKQALEVCIGGDIIARGSLVEIIGRVGIQLSKINI